MSELIKHIKEYFNTFNNKEYTIYVNGTPTEKCELNTFNNRDYTIYVNGTPTEKCELNDYTNYVVWRPLDNNKLDWDFIEARDIEAIKLSATTMEIITTNGKEYNFVAKPKTKEEKAKELIFWAKMSLHNHDYDDVLKYLDDLKALMDEAD